MSGAYSPSFTGPFNKVTLPSTVSPAPRLYGHGSPEGVMPGVPGQVYEDLDSTDQYIKLRGTSTLGWMQAGSRPDTDTGGGGGGGGTGSVNIFYGTGDPNGVVEAARPAFYYNTSGQIWAQTSEDESSEGWELILG